MLTLRVVLKAAFYDGPYEFPLLVQGCTIDVISGLLNDFRTEGYQNVEILDETGEFVAQRDEKGDSWFNTDIVAH